MVDFVDLWIELKGFINLRWMKICCVDVFYLSFICLFGCISIMLCYISYEWNSNS